MMEYGDYMCSEATRRDQSPASFGGVNIIDTGEVPAWGFVILQIAERIRDE